MSDGKTLLQKLTEAQTAIKPPRFDNEVDYTAKGRRVHYKYASLGACMEVAREALTPLGVAVWFELAVRDDESLYAVTCFSDGSETTERCPFPVKLNKSSQENGSEFTYAKRYSLCAALGIVADDDDDGQAASIPERKPLKRQKTIDEQNPLTISKRRLKTAIEKYADKEGKDAAAIMEGITHYPEYADNADSPEYFDMLAEDFEAAL